MLVLFSMPLFQNNDAIVARSRTLVSIVAGCGAGILGLTNLFGLLFFVLAHLTLAGLVTMRVKFRVTDYFTGFPRLLLSQLSSSALSFVLFWTLSYNLIHVYI